MSYGKIQQKEKGRSIIFSDHKHPEWKPSYHRKSRGSGYFLKRWKNRRERHNQKQDLNYVPQYGKYSDYEY